jgi:hypothetical protein
MPALSSQFNFIISYGGTTSTSVAIPSASTSTNGTSYFESIPQKGDGYFGNADGLHTVTYTVTPNFVGTLTMQATLATAPIAQDWFNVVNSAVEYTEINTPATTTTNYINFTGNFVWVRAVVNRDALQPNGSVMWINYNH